MVRAWIDKPTNVRPLHHLYSNAKPLLVQLQRSGYMFAFALPKPLASILGWIGNFWTFRLLNAFSESNNPVQPLTGNYGWDMLASSTGPGVEELKTELQPDNKPIDPLDQDEPFKYPFSVKHRASTGGWFEKLRLYRENLVQSPWHKSLQLVWELNRIEQDHPSLSTVSSHSSSSSTQKRRSSSAQFKSVGVFDIGPPGSLAAATTVIWGAKDVALNTALATDGIKDYFGVRESHFLVLPTVGHWAPLSNSAFPVWKAVISWAVKGEDGPLKERLNAYPNVDIRYAG
jgi:hypothetical protein